VVGLHSLGSSFVSLFVDQRGSGSLGTGTADSWPHCSLFSAFVSLHAGRHAPCSLCSSFLRSSFSTSVSLRIHHSLRLSSSMFVVLCVRHSLCLSLSAFVVVCVCRCLHLSLSAFVVLCVCRSLHLSLSAFVVLCVRCALCLSSSVSAVLRAYRSAFSSLAVLPFGLACGPRCWVIGCWGTAVVGV
jgi:hypothetical protein